MLIALGYNDMGTNMVPATFKTNMQTVIAKLRELKLHTPVVIVADPARPRGAFTYFWSDYQCRRRLTQTCSLQS